MSWFQKVKQKNQICKWRGHPYLHQKELQNKTQSYVPDIMVLILFNRFIFSIKMAQSDIFATSSVEFHFHKPQQLTFSLGEDVAEMVYDFA